MKLFALILAIASSSFAADVSFQARSKSGTPLFTVYDNGRIDAGGNIQGYNNIAVGKWSFQNNVNGANCAAFGFDALAQNETGCAITAIGYDALWSNVSGGSSTAVGSQAGLSNRIGNYNTFVGVQTGRNGSSGSFNTFIGSQCGYFLQSGSNNTTLGSHAGFKNLVGNGNIMIGFRAGCYDTKTENTFILDSIDRGSADKQRSDALMIGTLDRDARNQSLKINAVVQPSAIRLDSLREIPTNQISGWVILNLNGDLCAISTNSVEGGWIIKKL